MSKNKELNTLDNVLLNIDGNDWTTRDACTGVICFGMTGSGKSSGPLRHIAIEYLNNNYGGVVFCAKPDELGTWEGYAKETGREKDIVKLSEETFNFLDYEFSRPKSEGGGQIENAVNIFLEIVNITKDKRSGGGTNDEYWQNAIKQFLRNSISLLVLSKEPITLVNIKKVIDSACRSSEDAKSFKEYCKRFLEFCEVGHIAVLRESGDVKDFIEAQKEFNIISKDNVGSDWHAAGFESAERYCNSLLLRASFFLNNVEAPDFELAKNYFITEFPQLDDRTRSNTISSFTVLADAMLRGEFLRCFCSPISSLNLEDIYRKGKILIVDQDVKKHGLVGQMTGAIIKLCFEKMIERREDFSDDNAKPVFLWADECQFFAIDYDQKFQTTARSSRTLTVYATQNLGNLFDGYGKDKAFSLIGNLGTKFFCQNGDYETNKWAADSIGQEVVKRKSQNLGDSKSKTLKGDYNKSDSFSEGWSEQKDYVVDIALFSKLLQGGPRGQCKVEYIFWQSGRILAGSKVFSLSTFNQDCRLSCGATRKRKCPALPGQKSSGNKGFFIIRLKDWMCFILTVFLFTVGGTGLYLIYSGRDILVFNFQDKVIITAATFLLASLIFAFEYLLNSFVHIFEILKFAISKKERPVERVIHGIPLYMVSAMCIFASFIMAIIFQKAIYNGNENIAAFSIYWLLLSFFYKFFKSSGNRKIEDN